MRDLSTWPLLLAERGEEVSRKRACPGMCWEGRLVNYWARLLCVCFCLPLQNQIIILFSRLCKTKAQLFWKTHNSIFLHEAVKYLRQTRNVSLCGSVTIPVLVSLGESVSTNTALSFSVPLKKCDHMYRMWPAPHEPWLSRCVCCAERQHGEGWKKRGLMFSLSNDTR